MESQSINNARVANETAPQELVGEHKTSHGVPAAPHDTIPAAGFGVAADGYRGPQVCAIVGITYRQLDYWARTDLVRPSLVDAAGSGTQRLYSYRDLVELKVIKNLIDAGIALQSARRAIDYLRANLGVELGSAHLVLQGQTSVLAFSGDDIFDLLQNGQGVLNIVALGPVVDAVDGKLCELLPSRPTTSTASPTIGVHAASRPVAASA